ncbi:MAG: site-2 protease family protein [Nitrospirae bacterium]|nr:site-2 protease family protein [Nitrospirota bacterium]
MLNVLLFLITIITTLFVGTLRRGGNPLQDLSSLRLGMPFSFTLMSILLVHELAHYFTSRRHKVKTSLPYFIPAPTFLGTFGAVIRMKSPMPNRNALLDVGISGPLAGFVLSLVAIVIGLNLSPVIGVTPQKTLGLGSSLLFSLMAHLAKGSLPAGYSIALHPIAFAGWIGFLITSINLLPAGQLDGGHIAYALLGRKHSLVARFVFFAMLGLSLFWIGWFIWAILIFFMGEKHPPPLDDITPIDKKRKVLALIALLIFILTFIPTPFGSL